MTKKTTPTLYCSAEDVIKLTGVKLEHYGYKIKQGDSKKQQEDKQKKFDKLLKNYIKTATSMIDKYTKNSFKPSEIPDTVTLVCSLIVSNIIAYASVRREVPVRKKDDWSQDIVKVEIFPDELKEMLDDYVKKEETGKRTGSIFAITGD